MNDQVNENTEEKENETQNNAKGYPSTFSQAELATEEGMQELADTWGVTVDGLADHRVFDAVPMNEDGTFNLPEGFDIVIDFRDDGTQFSENPGAFMFALPTFDELMKTEAGQEYCREAVFSAMFRKHAMSANAVNREGGTWSPPTNIQGWITGTQSQGSGRKRVPEQLFRKVQSVVASGIAKMLKNSTGQSFPAKDLKAILTSDSFTQTAYAVIANSEGAVERIADVVKEAMVEKAQELNKEAKEAEKDAPYPDQASIDKQLATIDLWMSQREAAEEIKPKEVDFGSFSLAD